MAMNKKAKIITLSSIISVFLIGVIVFLCFVPTIQRNTEIKKYYKQKVAVFEMENLELGSISTVFLGDEIIENYNLSVHFKQINALNRGIKNDSTSGILNRLDVSVVDIRPKVVVLQVGTHKLDKVLTYYEDILKTLKEKLPIADVVILSICPTSGEYAGRNEKIVQINNELKALAEKYNSTKATYKYVDIHSLLMNPETGELDKSYSDDGLLLNEQGYSRITDGTEQIDGIKDVVNECLL